jgi:outer membrane receptor protein involved in Fe transport
MMRIEKVVPVHSVAKRPHILSACGIALAWQLTCLPLANAQLEEVVVTAQKRSESLLDVPIAVTAFSQEALGELTALL